jgi:hypothetical protein
VSQYVSRLSKTKYNVLALCVALVMLTDVVIFLCSTSDDNLLKNIELFDKLSLRFSGRVLFIKDVIGSSEICCWSFYGHGKKVAEVCCTSIVYATDKKHTKVTFASHCHRIYVARPQSKFPTRPTASKPYIAHA